MLQHSALYAFGNIADRVVAFLAIPFYSRFLSPAQCGLIELIELSTQTVAITFGLQAIGTALTRLYHDQASPEAKRRVASTALLGTAMLSGGVTVASVAASGAISRAVFADFFRSLLLINKRSVWVGQIALAAAVLNLLSNMLLIPAYGIYGAAWATLLTWSAYLVVCWIAADREHRLPIRIAPHARLLGLMMAVYAAVATVRVGSFTLQMALDGASVALFAAAAVFVSAPGQQAILRLSGPTRKA